MFAFRSCDLNLKIAVHLQIQARFLEMSFSFSWQKYLNKVKRRDILRRDGIWEIGNVQCTRIVQKSSSDL